MSSTLHVEPPNPARRSLLALVVASSTPTAFGQPNLTIATEERAAAMTQNALLTTRQLAIGPVATATALGDMSRLTTALERGLDAGLTVNELKEVLVQLYAYAGFPRSLNALTELMKVLDGRRKRGIADAEGKAPGVLPVASQMLEVGTANQTKLIGAPVQGPLFEFAPAIDQYLKSHLFGDIFARDNLSWQSRELATVGALSAMAGVEPQLLSHIRIGLNVGLTVEQLHQFAVELSARGEPIACQRVTAAVDAHLETPKR